ncbi:hypothetical protein ACWEIK_00635 [Streptomyces sp. NPDC004673]
MVYKIHFPSLHARKVGITNTEVRHDRVQSHVARGGLTEEQVVVPNKEAARTVENHVLRLVQDFPSRCTARDFPQGGHTETWSADGPDVSLQDVVAELAEKEAPGFGRLRKLQEEFEDAPLTIDELIQFEQIEHERVGDMNVYHFGLSEPLEQVLRKVKAQRQAIEPHGLPVQDGHHRWSSRWE